jgi:glycine cleavage system H protein
MSFPKDLKYTREHEWIRLDGKNGIIGITAYALEQLGDVVHLELPKVGESEVNSAIAKDLEALAADPYKNGWLIKVAVEKEDGELISAGEYESFIAED